MTAAEVPAVDEVAAVSAEGDPIERARRAGALIEVYRQRQRELGRLRAEAIEAAASRRGMTYSSVAAELGLTRGRISQIRSKWPSS